MKNLISLLLVGLFTFTFSSNFYAQDKNDVDTENHGDALNIFVSFGDNTAVGANYEISLSNDITFSPEAKIWFAGDNNLALGARADYYFDRIFKLHSSWDIWAGVDGSFLLGEDDGFYLNLHAGVEYLINGKWGVILEFGGGKAASGGLGIAIHL